MSAAESVSPTSAAPGAEPASWSAADAEELYHVGRWGQGFFRVGDDGELRVDPTRDGAATVSLLDIVEGLRARGFGTPLLLRFPGILRSRLADLAKAFEDAIREHSYRGRYHGVYPIKVNQQARLVEEILRFGAEHGFGVEVGSKPELLAVMSLMAEHPDRLVVCNGFKDERYLEAAVLSAKIGRNVIPVVEGLGELRTLIEQAEKHGVRPRIGARVKLATRGIGRWGDSSGHRAKFGLMVSELLAMVELLREADMLDCFELLHCHVGSQIHDIRHVKRVVSEVAHVYAELVRLGAGLRYLDIGGGLGVDYDGNQRSEESSMNYTMEEYAADVVSRVSRVCDQAGIEHPDLITESGRAMVSFDSVLVMDVLGRSSLEELGREPIVLPEASQEEPAQPLLDLAEIHDDIDEDNFFERYHDAVQAREEALDLFSLGYLDLEGRALAERLFWSAMVRIRDAMRADPEDYAEKEEVEAMLADVYSCNFSLFQSMPDVWAIGQVFPILPIHRLDEEPTRRGVIADLTCDSDGKVDRFVSDGEPKRMVELHPLREGERYYLGAFLVGAYQETLGDLHNLFGDTHVAHIAVEGDGHWYVEDVVPGDTVREVLGYVQYDPARLMERLRRDCEHAVRRGKLTVEEGRILLRFYGEGLDGSTYMEPPNGSWSRP